MTVNDIFHRAVDVMKKIIRLLFLRIIVALLAFRNSFTPEVSIMKYCTELQYEAITSSGGDIRKKIT